MSPRIGCASKIICLYTLFSSSSFFLFNSQLTDSLPIPSLASLSLPYMLYTAHTYKHSSRLTLLQCCISPLLSSPFLHPPPSLPPSSSSHLLIPPHSSLPPLYTKTTNYLKACAAPLLPALTSLARERPIGPTDTPSSAPIEI